MTLLLPIALTGVPLLLLAGLALARGGSSGTVGLPGSWGAIVEPALRRYLAAAANARRGHQAWLCVAIAGLIVGALSRPAVEIGETPNFGNLAARVLVVDLGAGRDARRSRLAAEKLLGSMPDVPTAVVAVAGEAYTVVPPTTDRRHIARYLGALAPEVMPVAGRKLHVGLAHAEAILRRVGYAVGQIVLISDGPPPPDQITIAGSKTQRTIMPVAGDPDEWRSFANLHGAALAGAAAADQVTREFRRAIERVRSAGTPGATVELAPFIIAASMLLWLALFRRRARS